jgi:hypothetical protein
MFGFRSNNTTIRPPAVVTTLGQLKQQYEDPDWSHPPQLQQQHAESRGDQYAYDRGGIDDRRYTGYATLTSTAAIHAK